MSSRSKPPRPALALALGVAVLAGCVDPIDLDVEGEAGRLVVDGLVREGPGPHTVRLTTAAAFERGLDAIEPAVVGARVTVSVDGGGAVPFAEDGRGVYRSAPGALVGVPGRSYALRVELADGRTFASSPETMPAAPPVARAYTEFVEGEALVGTTLRPRPAIELRVESADPPGERNYYRWVWTGEAVLTPEAGGVCYAPQRGRSLVEVADDRLTDGGVLTGQTVESFRLSDDAYLFLNEFYLEVEQQALTADAYAFWSRVRETRDRVGGLFDPPPDAVVGNVASVADPDDYALGYFTVAGTARATTCTTLSDFPDRPLVTLPEVSCEGRASRPSPAFVEACSTRQP